MRRSKLHVSLAITMVLLISASMLASTFIEDFSSMPVGTCYRDGSAAGAWQFVHDGYGCNGFVAFAANTMLLEQPATFTSPSETHASLVVAFDQRRLHASGVGRHDASAAGERGAESVGSCVDPVALH
jgi:hypothetical protein